MRGAGPFREYRDETAGQADGALSFVEGAVEIFTTGDATDLAAALRELLAEGHDRLHVQAFLNRIGDAEVARLRPLAAAAAG